jgi:2-oxoglutarate ferredoxin oxidoreductase subunit alpha
MAAFQAGWNFGETTEAFSVRYEVKPAPLKPAPTGTSSATRPWPTGSSPHPSWPGCRCSSAPTRSRPASDILHELAKHKRFGVRTFQAEDEIAAVGAALGASFGGSLSVTTTSGPGILLKAETIGLAVSVELPLIVCNIQRAGPSTGMPTKTEQADLLQSMFGRNGESPIPVLAAASPCRLLQRGDRGGPDRGQVPHPGDPALRRLPRERLRAVAHPQHLTCPT